MDKWKSGMTTRVKRSAFYCEEEGVLREAKTQIKLSNILQPPESKGHKEGENIRGLPFSTYALRGRGGIGPNADVVLRLSKRGCVNLVL